MKTVLEIIAYIVLTGCAGFYLRIWYVASDRKYRYNLAVNKRKTRLQARKQKAERLLKYGPPGLLEQAICGFFDAYIHHTFPPLKRK